MSAKILCSSVPRSSAKRLRLSLAILVTASLIGTGLPDSLSAAPPRPRPRPRLGSRPRPVPRVVHKLPPKVYRKLPPRAVRPAVIPRRAPRLVIASRPAVVVSQEPRVIAEMRAPRFVTAVKDLAVVPVPEVAPSQAFRVVRVDDSYLVTLLINGAETPVRLVGIDPPLVPASDGMPAPPHAARHFLQNLLAGEMVYLDRDPNLAQKDEEGNLVAYIYRAPDKLQINIELIRQGYALVAEGYKFAYQQEFLSYQQKARADGKGIWAMMTGTDL